MFAIVVFTGYILVKFSEKGSQKTQKGNLKLVEYFMLYHILLLSLSVEVMVVSHVSLLMLLVLVLKRWLLILTCLMMKKLR